MKYLKMHDLLRDLCLREAEKERFYHVVGQHSPQGTCSQRRVVILQNTSRKKVVDAMNSTPYVRTCISSGKRVQSLSNLRFLRTLETHNNDIVHRKEYSLGNLFELVNLRLLIVHFEKYLTKLPSSINLLWSLQTLIVQSEQNIIYAPVEIWNMPQLRHVHFYGFDFYGNATVVLYLPDPQSDNIVIMENLQTLKRVMNFKCDMVRRIPNIKKLGLIYRHRLGRTKSRDDGSCLHNIERMQKLESFHCKGDIWDEDSLRNLTFPQSLKSLTLEIKNGRMEEILLKVSTLPLLLKLTLKYGSFTTGKWETVEGPESQIFVTLLVFWFRMVDDGELPLPMSRAPLSFSIDIFEGDPCSAEVGEIPTLKSLYLFKCTESAARSVKRMIEEQKEEQLCFQVTVRHSVSNMAFDKSKKK